MKYKIVFYMVTYKEVELKIYCSLSFLPVFRCLITVFRRTFNQSAAVVIEVNSLTNSNSKLYKKTVFALAGIFPKFG
jgi:hypothetical protein